MKPVSAREHDRLQAGRPGAPGAADGGGEVGVDHTPPRARGRFSQAAARWGPVVLWVGVILFASGDQFSAKETGSWLGAVLRLLVGELDPATFDILHATVRKGAHLVEYAVLGFLTCRALAWNDRRVGARHWMLSLAIAAACAVTDEVHQSFIASRTSSPVDVLIDCIGAGLGVLVAQRWLARRPWARSTPAEGGAAVPSGRGA